MKVELHAIKGIPNINLHDNIGEILFSTLKNGKIQCCPGDIFVVAHKIVSKSEGRIVSYKDIKPSSRAIELARKVRKDPRKVEVILSECKQVIRAIDRPDQDEGVIITEHKLGFISANSCIDESNIEQDESCLLLPQNPDQSARELRSKLENFSGVNPIGVIISDTFGRAWRIGQLNVAIGLAGVPAAPTLKGAEDAFGYKLRVTQPAFADEIAASSGLLMTKGGKVPIILCRGLEWIPGDNSARDLIRAQKEDLFR